MMNNKIKNTFSKLKDKFFLFGKVNPKLIYVFIGFFAIILGYIVICIILSNTNNSTITYNKLETLIKNKDTAIVYYYNSKSSNKNNQSVKRYLDKNGIRYYVYNDSFVEKKEYNNFLKLLNIDKKVFGLPAIIYINNGKMYANLINIDSTDVVKDFIDHYDLYTVK